MSLDDSAAIGAGHPASQVSDLFAYLYLSLPLRFLSLLEPGARWSIADPECLWLPVVGLRVMQLPVLYGGAQATGCFQY